jgi:hypothetical protein
VEAVTIIPGLTTKTLGFHAYCALKNKFDFSLKVGQIVNLHVRIKGDRPYDDWTLGYYKVISIGLGLGSSQSYKDDARFYSYTFEKVRKDGSKVSGKFYGWNCQSFDHDLLSNGSATTI